MSVIEKDLTLLDLLVKMAEGNPGAAVVLSKMANHKNGYTSILILQSLNILGWKIWFGYKDGCDMNIEKFIELIMNADEDLIDLIKEEEITNEDKK